MKIKPAEPNYSTQLLLELYLRLYCLDKNQEKGYALVVVLIIVLILLPLLMAYALLAKLEMTISLASADSNTGFYGAEAGLNLRANAIQQAFTNFARPTGTSPSGIEACLDNDNTNNGSGAFACTPYTFGQAGKPQHTASTYVEERPGNPRIGVIPRGEPFQNLNMQEYTYRLRSATTKAGDSRPEAITEMDIRSRVVPLFQFAVFYQNDLEILPGPSMTLGGPVHTNSSLYLGSGDVLRIRGQITTSGDVFNRRKNDTTTYASGRVRVDNSVGTAVNLLDANGGSQTTAALSRTNLTSIWGNQIRTGFDQVTVPPISILNRTGEYFDKADLRIEYRPDDTVPVAVTSIKRNTNSPAVTLSLGENRSLLQPVMTNVNCPALTPPAISLTAAQRTAVAGALQVSLASAQNPVASLSTFESSTLGTLNTGAISPATGSSNLQALVTTRTSSAVWTLVSTLTANQVAALAGRCFKAAPLIVNTNFYNNREAKTMRLLQINVEGLTVWNRDGIYVDFSAAGAVTSNNSNNGFSADEKLFDRALVDTDTVLPENFFQRFSRAINGTSDPKGLAAADTTEGGLVFHASVVPTVTANITNANGTQSRYGFALTNASQLPGLAQSTTYTDPTGLTVASDQAIYVQGNYNNVNKQPAAVLADSINVLSRFCINNNNLLNCGISGTAPAVKDGDTATLPASNEETTFVNAAFLSGTDNTTASAGYNGGLENYPRFHENWNPANPDGGQRSLTYRGAFISLGPPERVSGTWASQRYSAPVRNWDYDTDFNDFAKLPPLSPNFVYLRQDFFVRDFER